MGGAWRYELHAVGQIMGWGRTLKESGLILLGLDSRFAEGQAVQDLRRERKDVTKPAFTRARNAIEREIAKLRESGGRRELRDCDERIVNLLVVQGRVRIVDGRAELT